MRRSAPYSTAEAHKLCGALAAGDLTPALIHRLWEIQRGRNQLLIEAIRRRLRDRRADLAFRTLAEIQESAPHLMARLLVLPQVGCWAVECLRQLRDHEEPDVAYLTAFAAGAAIRAGQRPELSPGTLIPGLGTFTGYNYVPIPTLNTESGGLRLSVRLDTADPYLQGFGAGGSADPAWWQRELDRAWRVLAERHRPAAETIASVFTTLVPLPERPGRRPFSAASGWAYGAIALSPPPSPAAFAESLVHEVQHLMLGAVEDVVQLTDPADERRWYVPWRSDPRPLGAMLQGCLANVTITAFWRGERTAGGERAQTEFAYRRATTYEALCRADQSGGLTSAGEILVRGLRGRLGPWLDEPVPRQAERQAAERRAEHRNRWLRANPGLKI
jgi:hypothetical protein